MNDDEKFYRASWMTDDHWRCAQVAAELKRGFHHVQDLAQCGAGISFWEPNEIATFDFDLMTKAVLLAHARAVRIGASAREFEEEFEGHGYSTTKLIITIHPRRHDDQAPVHIRHPNLSDLLDPIERLQT